jgi:hypothetical protein
MSKSEKKFGGKWLIKILKPDNEVATIIKDYGVKQSSDIEEELTFDDENKRNISLNFDKKNFKVIILFVIRINVYEPSRLWVVFKQSNM